MKLSYLISSTKHCGTSKTAVCSRKNYEYSYRQFYLKIVVLK